MTDFLDDPKKWVSFNVNLIIGFLFGVTVPFTAWILLLGYFKPIPIEKSLSIGSILGLPIGIMIYYLFIF